MLGWDAAAVPQRCPHVSTGVSAKNLIFKKKATKRPIYKDGVLSCPHRHVYEPGKGGCVCEFETHAPDMCGSKTGGALDIRADDGATSISGFFSITPSNTASTTPHSVCRATNSRGAEPRGRILLDNTAIVDRMRSSYSYYVGARKRQGRQSPFTWDTDNTPVDPALINTSGDTDNLFCLAARRTSSATRIGAEYVPVACEHPDGSDVGVVCETGSTFQCVNEELDPLADCNKCKNPIATKDPVLHKCRRNNADISADWSLESLLPNHEEKRQQVSNQFRYLAEFGAFNLNNYLECEQDDDREVCVKKCLNACFRMGLQNEYPCQGFVMTSDNPGFNYEFLPTPDLADAGYIVPTAPYSKTCVFFDDRTGLSGDLQPSDHSTFVMKYCNDEDKQFWEYDSKMNFDARYSCQKKIKDGAASGATIDCDKLRDPLQCMPYSDCANPGKRSNLDCLLDPSTASGCGDRVCTTCKAGIIQTANCDQCELRNSYGSRHNNISYCNVCEPVTTPAERKKYSPNLTNNECTCARTGFDPAQECDECLPDTYGANCDLTRLSCNSNGTPTSESTNDNLTCTCDAGFDTATNCQTCLSGYGPTNVSSQDRCKIQITSEVCSLHDDNFDIHQMELLPNSTVASPQCNCSSLGYPSSSQFIGSTCDQCATGYGGKLCDMQKQDYCNYDYVAIQGGELTTNAVPNRDAMKSDSKADIKCVNCPDKYKGDQCELCNHGMQSYPACDVSVDVCGFIDNKKVPLRPQNMTCDCEAVSTDPSFSGSATDVDNTYAGDTTKCACDADSDKGEPQVFVKSSMSCVKKSIQDATACNYTDEFPHSWSQREQRCVCDTKMGLPYDENCKFIPPLTLDKYQIIKPYRQKEIDYPTNKKGQLKVSTGHSVICPKSKYPYFKDGKAYCEKDLEIVCHQDPSKGNGSQILPTAITFNDTGIQHDGFLCLTVDHCENLLIVESEDEYFSAAMSGKTLLSEGYCLKKENS